MTRGPRWREIPPHDFCMTCRQGDAGRAIIVRGDQEWLARIFALTTGHDLEMAEKVAAGIWRAVPTADTLPDFKAFPFRFCRRCANLAVERIVASGLHRPGVYNHARLERGEYEDPEGVDQPKMVRMAGRLVESLVCTEEMFAAHAAEGATLRRWWNEEDQQWCLLYASYPVPDDEEEIKIGEVLFPPAKLPGE